MLKDILRGLNEIDRKEAICEKIDMTDVMTNFYLSTKEKKIQFLHDVLKHPKGLLFVEFVLLSSEYRGDFHDLIKDKTLAIVYESMRLKNSIA